MWYLSFSYASSSTGQLCPIGTEVFCPFPGLSAFVQAIVLSPMLDGEFIVQWSGSPELCSSSTSRSQCIVDASACYDTAVSFLSSCP